MSGVGLVSVLGGLLYRNEWSSISGILSHVAPNFLIFLTMMTGLPFYLDKAESKKTKIGWFVFTIIAVIFDVFIVYVL